jgi:hypothetical protein
VPNLHLHSILKQNNDLDKFDSVKIDHDKNITQREIKSLRLYDEIQNVTTGFRIGTIHPSQRGAIAGVITQTSPRL